MFSRDWKKPRENFFSGAQKYNYSSCVYEEVTQLLYSFLCLMDLSWAERLQLIRLSDWPKAIYSLWSAKYFSASMAALQPAAAAVIA